MAEAALFSVATDLLSTLASPAFKMAYERASSIWYAQDELNKLIKTIEILQAGLLDAERRQIDSGAVKIWMNRVKDALYDADDLFDEVAADELLRQQMKGNKVAKKVRVSCSWLNPILSDDSIAKKVKSIRKCLLEISEDMKPLYLVENRADNLIKEGRDLGSFVDPESVIGRDKDKEVILTMLLHESKHDVGVIAIVGIGGMGKTTLTQLIYNDKKVEMEFEKRCFACISDSSTDIEVYGKIYQSIEKNYKLGSFSVGILQDEIQKSIMDKKYLLVLDDVWDDKRAMWEVRMKLLSSGAEGSKIIVSTRSNEVARAVGASQTHNLRGLSEEDSWNLFKRASGWTEDYDRDSRRMNLGRDIVKKCANVPLAIKSTGCLLFEKNTIEEWESISKKTLSWVGDDHKDGVLPVLKLSYDYLPSNLKHCFAYCSLFPKDREFNKDELIHLWIAQGFINSAKEKEGEVEDTGNSYFMYLLRRSFFQIDMDEYKMHDLMHDLAKHVAGEETSLLSDTPPSNVIGRRHVSICYVAPDSRVPPETLHNLNRQRSFLLITRPKASFELDQWIRFPYWKSLRALKLSWLGIENIPSSIGELKQLRYLDISCNKFQELPDTITKLVNLCTLDINFCIELEALPRSFVKLGRLRHLYNWGCEKLKHLPDGFEELTCLQHLSEFKVGKGTNGGLRFPLDRLSRLKLRGKLKIRFEEDNDTHEWDGIECFHPLPTLEYLEIYYYHGIQIPNWGNENLSSLPILTSLTLYGCTSVKCLPSFRHIPNLRILHLDGLDELEYIEEEALFIPDLKKLTLCNMLNLKGWSRKECSIPILSASLTYISFYCCPELSFSGPGRETTSTLNSSSSVEYWSFPGYSLTSLRKLSISESKKLKKVELPPSHLNKLEELDLRKCPELELWEENNRGVDWDSLPKLNRILIDKESVPSSEMLPECLRRLQELGQIKIYAADDQTYTSSQIFI